MKRGFLTKSNCVNTSWNIKCIKDLYCYGKSIGNFDQPFYEILVDKANSKYVSEGNTLAIFFFHLNNYVFHFVIVQMELHFTPGLADVKNRDLGLHFQKFNGLIFVPNVVCQARLPEDEEFA
jgi:hypothetical protein